MTLYDGHGRPRLSEDVDPVAVDNATSGRRASRLNATERAEAVALLTERGCSAAQIAERLHMSIRGVNRWRARGRASF